MAGGVAGAVAQALIHPESHWLGGAGPFDAVAGCLGALLVWGFVTGFTRAEIEIEMGTARIGGFKRPLRVLGQLVFRYCSEPEDAGCQLVEAMPLDPATGYVNAVGQVWVHSPILDLFNFSPMGEAIFLELDPDRDLLAGGQP